MYIKIKNKKAQSTVEYVLLVTAVVTVMIGIFTYKGGFFSTQLNSTLNTAAGDMSTMSTQLQDSHNPSPAPVGVDAGTPPYSVNVNVAY